MEAARRNAERLFPAADSRCDDAAAWLGGLLSSWGVHTPPTRRWISSARDTLRDPHDLVPCAQYDPVLLLFSLEVWHSGRRVYGIDDWLG